MIAIDTNVLVRLLVKDDASQTAQVVALFGRLSKRGERARVSDIVLCELVWVLTRSYGFGRTEVVAVIQKLATARQLALSSTDSVLRAVRAFESGKGDLADYLIREDAVGANCDSVATFDKALLREATFVRVVGAVTE